MLKNKFLIKAVSVTVMSSFAVASSPKNAEAERLVPISFSQMYNLAQNGEVEALRASVRRGMNIDVMNRNGDTGLCIAARRRDAYTYNAFRAAGANPRHPCTQYIAGYQEFVNSSGTASANSTSRAAYGMLGKEDYAIAPWVWWTLGAVAVGGGVALAFGGGGGGGGGSSSGTTVNPIDSAGKKLADNGTAIYTASKGQNKINSTTLSNTNTKTDVIDTLNFNQNVTENSKYLNVILKTVNGGSYENSEDTTLTANSGVVAMSAYKDSSLIVNNGQIKLNGNNASIGMLAGQSSLARNNGQDANGIYMSFSGSEPYHSQIAMYGDAGATITNNGTISGTVNNATNGSLIGMEEMIINSNINSKYTTISATNTENGVIRLIAGTGEDSQVNLIGMGTYLDDAIINGNKVIKNAEKATITNRGDILLQYLRKYIPDTDYFKEGIGGIVGMKADANSTATNEKNITIEIAALEASSITSDYATIAGMQSVHAGTITNSADGKILVEANLTDETSNQSAFGMVGVKGGGKVAETLGSTPKITNNGEIALKINNGYGMATYVGGTLTNNKTIILGDENSTFYKNNVGMYDSGQGSYSASLANNGDIIIYSSDSVGMKTDFGGRTTLTNDKNIIIKKSAVNSHPFAGKYSNIVNNGQIIYETTPTDNEGTDGSFPDNFSFDLKDAVINTDGNNTLEEGDQKPTVSVTNKGTITLNGSSYTAAIVNHNARLGTVINETGSNIVINDREGEEAGTALKNIGIYVTDYIANGSSAINRGSITVNTKYSAGMASDASAESVLLTNGNNGTINMTKIYSIGMYASDSSYIRNLGTVTIEGKDSYGIVVKGKGNLGHQQEIENNIIELKGDGSTAVYIADDSTAVITKAGTIKVLANNITGFRYGNDVKITEFPNFEIGDDYKATFTYFNIAKRKLELAISDTITSNGKYFVVADGSGYILNNTNINTGIANSTLLKGISSGLTSTNNATLTLQHDNTIGMYAADGHIIVNNGTIEIKEDGTNSSGMYAGDNGTANNTKTISVNADISNGMYAAANGVITNSNGTITVNKGYGMYAATGGNETNKGYITILGESAYGMYASAYVTAVNENTISVEGKKAYGMYAFSNGTVENDATINITGERAYGMYADAGAKAYNNNLINVKGKTAFGMYVNEDATLYNEETITITGQYASGIYVDRTGTAYNNGSINVNADTSVGMSSGQGEVYNNDTITINGNNSYGMYAGMNGTATNNDSVIIKAINVYGMYTSTLGNIINEGTITVTEDKSYGMYANDEGRATNKNTIDVNSNESFGMFAEYYSTVTNTGDGNINVAGKKSYGMYANSDANVTNKATIKITGANSYGMYANEDASISNDDTISVEGTSSFGMYTVSNGTIVNNKTITVSGSKSYGMYSETDGTATNTYSITVKGSNAYGIYNASSNSADNEDTITIEGSYAYGMYAATNGKVNNKSSVTVGGDNSYGLYAEGNGTAINSSSITVSGNSACGMYADTKTTTEGTLTGTITNNGSITVRGTGAKGMSANTNVSFSNAKTISVEGASASGMYATSGGTLNNNSGATISVSGASASGMYTASGGTLNNSSGATISVSGAGASGMYAASGGTLNNISSITVDGDNSYGIYLASGGNAYNGSSSVSSSSISVKGSSAAGMYSAGGGTSQNYGSITVNGGSAYGMFATGTSGKVINANKIDVTASGAYGMYAESNSTATNNSGKNINVNASGAYGMYASNGTATNYGTVTVTANNAYGMYATNGTVTNNGNIYANGIGSYGMYAAAGGTAYNYSSITVNGAGGYGMYAANGGTVINGSSGIISISDNGAYGIYNNGGNYANYGTINGGDDEHKIYPPEEEEEEKPAAAPSLLMSSPKSLLTASNYGKIINNGTIIADTALNFDESADSTGTISVGNGGSYVASSFSGNVVADSNIVTSGFDDIYTNTDSFVGEDSGLNITSGSYLFDAEKSLNNEGNIDVVMTKKDFADVVENSSLAEFLEQNYAEKNNENLFAALKSSSNSTQFNHNLDSLFGKELFSDLTFEDLNILHEINFNMNNNMFAQQKGAFSLADGTNILKDKNQVVSGGQYALTGYNDGKTSMAVGLAVSDIRVSKSSNNQSGQLNKNIMLSIPVARKVKGFELITSPKFGYAEGSYEREGLNGQTYDGKIEKRTFALMNEARYPLNFGGTKIVPSAEFNMIGYNIKGREDQEQYSLNIGSQNHYSVESGLGINMEREFFLNKDSQLKLNGGVAVYNEFADPYELKVGMNEMNGTYRLRSEKYGDKRTVLRFGAGYSLKENLELSAGIRANISNDYHTDAGVNLNYHF